MRSAPPSTAASNTLREPSTFTARVRSLALRIAKARCTTTSAPFTASRTLALSLTSPCRYSVLRRPASFGSNGRRAMPTIFETRRERSSDERIDMPRSPVGPVTATVSPSFAIEVLYRLRRGRSLREPVLAPVQHVALVGHHGVCARSAAHHVAVPVPRVHHVVASAGGDRVAPAAADHAVVARARGDVVVAGAAVDRERAAARS